MAGNVQFAAFHMLRYEDVGGDYVGGWRKEVPVVGREKSDFFPSSEVQRSSEIWSRREHSARWTKKSIVTVHRLLPTTAGGSMSKLPLNE